MIWKAVRHCPLFFIVLVSLLIIGLTSCILTSKLNSFTFLNFYHCPFLDLFFSYYTFMGDGIMCLFTSIVLFFLKKKKLALALLLAFLSSGIIVQILKKLLNEPRPSLYFEQIGFKYSYFINGIQKLHSASFPSGHSASAFAMCIVIALYFKDKRVSVLCLLLALFASYSRIYLAHHFLPDVMVGALIGSVSGLLTYYFVWRSAGLYTNVNTDFKGIMK
ncbi:membrane-associated phospholipid phosphatase [Pedobacter cryoconitis]|uniref:Membrane-associated phospholipid phosphatase n=1 Tax=Pedobacter cryoconitis TaxID=188932 RepID=A0A7W8YXY5_9SPHI|nr:phosphatase PAP2 family protein [Pedobacter cryoconitis]MBB5623877.1 membrane-associated phospholipid phosphatase [Pedobacter cryoconitis]